MLTKSGDGYGRDVADLAERLVLLACDQSLATPATVGM